MHSGGREQQGSNRIARRVRGGRRPNPFILVVLLALGLIITGILGWQALDAERSHRAAAERALKDYARFAAWQLNQQASQELLSAMISTFIVPLTRVDPAKPEAWPSPEEFMAASLQPPAPAKFLKGVRFFFRLNWRDSSVTIAGQRPSSRLIEVGAGHGTQMRIGIWGAPDTYTGVRVGGQKSRQAARNHRQQRLLRCEHRQHRWTFACCLLRSVARLRRTIARHVRVRDRCARIRSTACRFRSGKDTSSSSVPSAGVPRDSVLAVKAWAPMSWRSLQFEQHEIS